MISPVRYRDHNTGMHLHVHVQSICICIFGVLAPFPLPPSPHPILSLLHLSPPPPPPPPISPSVLLLCSQTTLLFPLYLIYSSPLPTVHVYTHVHTLTAIHPLTLHSPVPTITFFSNSPSPPLPSSPSLLLFPPPPLPSSSSLLLPFPPPLLPSPLQEPYCSVELFTSWILSHPQLASFTQWMLAEQVVGFSLQGDPDPPTFYQLLADEYGGVFVGVVWVDLLC